MKTLSHNKLKTLGTAIFFLVSITACSDNDTTETATTVSPSNTPSFDHAHGPEVTDLQKHKFEHDFAAQCIERELNNSSNKIEDANRFSKSCECIAAHMMKNLTVQEAEKFLNEHEHPQSLSIKFEAAAYECLQEKTPPKGPKLFGRPDKT
jgi:hypothetical protein